MRVIDLLSISFLLFGSPVWSNAAPTTSPTSLSFEKIEELPASSSQKQVETLFGKPTKTFRDKLSDKIHWLYIEGEYPMQRQALSVTFAGAESRLLGFNYSPKKTDQVFSLVGLLTRYPKLHLKAVAPSSCGQHFTANEGFEYDLDAGVTVHRNRDGNIGDISVSKLSSELRRNTASELNGCTDKEEPVELEEITPSLK